MKLPSQYVSIVFEFFLKSNAVWADEKIYTTDNIPTSTSFLIGLKYWNVSSGLYTECKSYRNIPAPHPHPAPHTPHFAALSQCLLHIPDNIFHRFYSNIHPDESICYSINLTLFFGHAVMGHGGRMRQKGIHSAQGYGADAHL